MAKGTLEGLKNWLGGEKTARPANVGPHDRQQDQHDPDAPGRRPEEMYSSEVEGQAAIAGPKSEASGKAPVTIKPKGRRTTTRPAVQSATATAAPDKPSPTSLGRLGGARHPA